MKKRSALSKLFPKLPPGAFARDYFPTRPVVAHGPVSRFGEVARERHLKSPMLAIEASHGETVLGYFTLADGRRHQAFFTKESAKEMFKGGVTLDSSHVHTTLDSVGKMAMSIKDELGLTLDQLICDAIVSPRGDSVPKHFDGIETLTVQLTGKKRWKIAPCPEAAFPYHSAFPGLDRNWRDGEDPYGLLPKTLSKAMPKGARTVMMRPGSVCFLPRGWWHETEALEPSISLSFVLRTPTIADAVISALTGELFDQPAWRRPMPVATRAHRRDARRAAAALLADGAKILGALDPMELFPPRDEERKYRTVSGGRIAWSKRARKADGWKIVVTTPAAEPLEIAADQAVAKIVRAISTRRGPFSLRELSAATRPYDPTPVVDTLLEAGYLDSAEPAQA